MPELSRAPLRRTEGYRDLVARTAAILTRDIPLSDIVAEARVLIGEFFETEIAVIVVCRGDDDTVRAEATLLALREQVFAERTMRVLRGDPPLRSPRGRSLHVPIRFGAELLGAVAVMAGPGEGFGDTDLALLEEWATLIAVRVNGSQLAAQNAALEALVGTDPLTGLRNRRGLDAELDAVWRAARGTGEPVALVMIDVDFFKAYNDRYGHLAGDTCLKQIATTIAAGLRPGDIAARFGGEEFVALLRDADRDRAVLIAERLRDAIAALGIAHAGSTLETLTASFGVATALPRAGHEASDTLAAADRILYVAKAAGRNRVAADGYASATAQAEPRYGGDHNLPVIASSFCGRVEDIAAVRAALYRSRLVTLVAFGGVGKTRLSLEVAGNCRGSYRHGVWFVDLAGSADPELLPERVAAAIGLPDVPGSRTVAGVAELLATRELLIVLDNCEHLIDACARFCAVMLDRADGVRILATSRERLDLPEEEVISLAPLQVPPPDAALSAADIARFPALKLFIDRASAAAPLALDERSLATIGAICRRLDGIALAIELAAARVRVVSVDELAARLETAFSVVGRAKGPGSARQRTLRGLIDWSYDLLDERERRVFSRLGTFAGAFTLDMANAVCGDDDDNDVLDILEELVDKSLVVPDAPEAGSRVFRLFESIRDYALERLTEAGEREVCRSRLVARVSAHAAAIAAARPTAAWRTSMEPLRHCVADVRACLELTIGGADPLAGARLAASLASFWQDRGRTHEGRTWIERALALPGLPPGLRAQLLNSFLWHQPLFGDAWRSAAMANEALELATQAQDEAQITEALAQIGDAAFDLGDYERSLDYCRRALERFVAAGDLLGEAYVCNGIGAALDLLEGDASATPSGDYTWYQRSIAACRRIDRTGFAARVLANIAESEFFLGRVDDGVAMTKDALADVERENDRPGMGWLLCNLGLFHQFRGEYDIAKGMLADALRVVLEIKDDWLIGACSDNLAGIALHAGRADCAAQFLGCADAIFGEIRLPRQPAFAALADGWRERARSILGAERFAAETAAGAQFSRAAVLVHALALGS